MLACAKGASVGIQTWHKAQQPKVKSSKKESKVKLLLSPNCQLLPQMATASFDCTTAMTLGH